MLVLWLAAVFGCSRDDQGPDLSHLPSSVEGSAVVSGRVMFVGTPPVLRELPNQPCHADAGPITDETVVLNPDSSLRNVIVWLEDGPQLDGSTRPAVTLDQINCQFVPHVLAVQIGQPLVISSQDPTLHNVHWVGRANPSRNISMDRPGIGPTVRFGAHEFLRVRCDVHPWMSAWIGVIEHPFFDVTGDGGRFTLQNVPAGSYTLAAWHEQYGVLRKPITVEDGGTLEVEFTYELP